MSLGRRKVRLEDRAAWVFNRMADVYDARPAYPTELVDLLAQLAAPTGAIVELGAGIGHLALPLAERGYTVHAVEPAEAMLERLREAAAARGLHVDALHATAETLPLPSCSCRLAVVADALHFLDAERAGAEIGRVLDRWGSLAVVFARFADTPFMRALDAIMAQTAPRRPRDVRGPLEQLARVAGVPLTTEQHLIDHIPLDHARLERILRSISFIGPAMNEERFRSFRERVFALSDQPVWSRELVVHSGTRARMAVTPN